MIDYSSLWNSIHRHFLNCLVIVVSVTLCLLILPTRLPGMELLGIGPNWMLIWVVAWSVKRPAQQGAIAGVAVGLLQDAMTIPDPTHAISLGIVGYLTGRLQKQRYVQEDFISTALIVFGMAILAETVRAVQFHIAAQRPYDEIWNYHQRIALSSAILSSLWAPVVCYPLNRWWEKMKFINSKNPKK